MADGTTVKGPEGTIRFPAGMSTDDISGAMAKLYPPKAPAQAEIRAHRPSMGEQLESAVPALGHIADIISGRKPAMSSLPLESAGQLVYPERVFSPTEQAQHPIRTGFDQVLGGLTSPENLLLMHTMSGELPNLIKRGASAIFAGQMGKGSYEAGHAAVDAYQRGDIGEAKRLATHAVVGGALTAGAGLHAGGEELRSTAKNLWQDESGNLMRPDGSIVSRAELQAAKDLHEQLAKAPKGPFLGGQAPSAEATGPKTTPVQAAEQATGRGESVRPTTGPSIKESELEQETRRAASSNDIKMEALQNEIKFLEHKVQTGPAEDRLETLKQLYNAKDRMDKIQGVVAEPLPEIKDVSKIGRKAAAEAAAKGPAENLRLQDDARLRQVFAQSQSVGGGEADWFTKAKAELFPGQRDLTNDQISEVAARAKEMAKAPTSQGRGLAPSPDVYETSVKELLKRSPNMAEATARRMVRDRMEKERGSLSLRPLVPQIGPQKAGVAWRAGDALEGLTNALGGAFGDLDAVSDPERQARLITRGIDSQKKLLGLQLEEKLKSTIEAHDNDKISDFRAFMDAGEGKPGAQFLKPEDQITATQLHNEFQKRWVKINDILERDNNAGIDNYLSHIWKRPGQAQVKLEQFIGGRRPIAGRGGFLKERVYQYASEGLDRGLEPLSSNPIRMQLAALHQIDKFITAHDLKDAYKEAGIAKWVGVGDKIPEGHQALSDKIFNPLTYKEEVGGLVKYGSYYAPPEVARIFNRYLDPGLSGNLAYDTLRGYGNLLNQVNLGLSGYHGSFITIVAGSSDVALGLEKVINNRDLGGINNILRGTIGTFSAPFDLAIQGIADKLGKHESVEDLVGSSSAGRFYRRGREIQKEALSPSTGPKTREQQLLGTYVQELVKAGAAFKQDQFYRTPEGQKFFRTLAQAPLKLLTGHPIEAAKAGYHAVQAGVQRFPITRGIMDYYVPRVKIGMASYMMEAKLQELVKNGVYDEGTIRTEMSKIWDSVDNRAGQMKYDNLFWNRSAKDLSFLAIRAVGWDLGTVREIGGAGVDVLSGLSKLAKGEKPSTLLSGRAAFVLGTTITLGTIGAVMTYLATGKAPQKTIDYFYPPTGRTGTNGKPERYALPTYAKDVVNFWNHPAKTAVGKLHPNVEQLYEFYNNRDFQDTEIYDRGGPDPLYKKGFDILRWWGKTTMPFAATTTLARLRGGEGLGPGASPTGIAIESFGGLQRASREISSSKAEDYIFDQAKRHWEAGPVSRESRDRREVFFKFRTQQRLGTLKDSEVSTALDKGQIRDQDFDRIYNDNGLSDSQSEFKFLASHDLSAAIKALQLMKPEERAQYREQVEDMMDGSQFDQLPLEVQSHDEQMVDSLMQAAPQ
jgi:hypothetical protein